MKIKNFISIVSTWMIVVGCLAFTTIVTTLTYEESGLIAATGVLSIFLIVYGLAIKCILCTNQGN